jgi:hypothetical protein
MCEQSGAMRRAGSSCAWAHRGICWMREGSGLCPGERAGGRDRIRVAVRLLTSGGDCCLPCWRRRCTGIFWRNRLPPHVVGAGRGLLWNGSVFVIEAAFCCGSERLLVVWVEIRISRETHIWRKTRMCLLGVTPLAVLEYSRLYAWQSTDGSRVRRHQIDSTCRGGCSRSRPWRTWGAEAGLLASPGPSWVAGICVDAHSRVECGSRHCSDRQVEFGLAF